jgi:hypothetical protein
MKVELITFVDSLGGQDNKLSKERAERWTAEMEEDFKRRALIEKAMSEVANKIVKNGDCFNSAYDTGITLIAKNGDRYKVGIVVMLDEETPTGTINK